MTFEKFEVGAIALVIGLVALTACGPASRPPPAPPAAKPTVARPAAKPMVMICKNSQTGLNVECGTPNAVMVGMKPA